MVDFKLLYLSILGLTQQPQLGACSRHFRSPQTPVLLGALLSHIIFYLHKILIGSILVQLRGA